MSTFTFKEFTIFQKNAALKVGTDAMILGAFINSENHTSCLDIGAGTGVLSLMIAQRNSKINIDAIEIDENSVIDLQTNFKLSIWLDRLNIIHSNFLNFEFQKKYDLIVSNPPFYETKFENQKENIAVAKHESSLPFDLLFHKVKLLLQEKGQFYMILPTENVQKWRKFALENELFCLKEITLFAKPNKTKRTILVFSKQEISTEISSLVIRNEDNSYTDEYIELTKDFHNKKLI